MNRLRLECKSVVRRFVTGLQRYSSSAESQIDKNVRVETLTEPLSRPVGQPSWLTHPHILKHGELIPGMHQNEFASRRRRIFELFVEHCENETKITKPDSYLMLFPAATTFFSAPDIPYPFRQDSNFLYLTGYQDPDSVLAIYGHRKGSEIDPVSVLLVGERSVHKELWEGPQSGPDGALLLTGVDVALDKASALIFFQSEMPFGCKTVVATASNPPNTTINTLITQLTPSMNMIGTTCNISNLMHELRWLKSASEVALLSEVASMGCQSLNKTMKFTTPGIPERLLTANYNLECTQLGAERLAYPPVVAGGDRANIIHYLLADQLLKKGDVVLMDAGCESHGYVCDITRTWSVDTNMTDVQLSAWQALLEVHEQLLHTVVNTRPLTLNQVYNQMVKLLCTALTKLNAVDPTCQGSQLEQLARDVCPHHVSHYLGMDVHDCSSISRDRPLQSGAYITVEPGLYFQTEDTAFRKEFGGLGMRVEDDIMITENGATNFTKSCPYYR